MNNNNFKFDTEEINRIKKSSDPYSEILNIIHKTDNSINKSVSSSNFKKANSELLTHLRDNICSNFNNKKKLKLLACFSETNLINPMWAHYAQNHMGICIEYDFKTRFTNSTWVNSNFEPSEGLPLSNYCFPVSYVKNSDQTGNLIHMTDKTKINHLKLNEEPFLKKSADWSYEKEWRIKLNPDPFLWFHIKKINSKYFTKISKPRAVFLGLNLEKDYKNKIEKICLNREISLFEMVKDNSGYNLQQKKLLDFPVGEMDDVNYIKKSIKNKFYKNLIYFHFSNNLTLGSMIDSSNLIIKSFEDMPYDEISCFLDVLLFKKEYNPVPCDYYGNILLFMIQLYNQDDYSYLKTSDGKNIKENLIEWIELSFSGFYKKPVIRYLIIFEKFLKRFYSRFAVLDNENREIFKNKLSNFYEIHDNFIFHVYPPCAPDLKLPNEEFFKKYGNKTPFKNPDSYIHPFCDPDLPEIIDKYILNNLNLILKEFYTSNTFSENNCYNEFIKLKETVEELEKLTENEFNKIMEENRNCWGLHIDQKLSSSYDFLINITFWVLSEYDEILFLLSEDLKEKLKIFAGIRISLNYHLDNNESSKGMHMSTFAEKCCDKLDLSYEEKFVSLKWLNEYFNPKKNPTKILLNVNN